MAYSGPSYYPTSQPGYGGHSPSPRPAYPSYPPPPPQQPPMHHHQPPRYNTNHSNRGGPRNGSYNGRGAHNHHHHHHPHPHHPQPYYPPQPYSPISPHPGGTVHYAAPPAKFHQPYSPSYPYPSPAAPVFTPSWQTQPISPLPKQLSMPPPQNAPPVFYEQPQPSPTPPAPAEPAPASPPPLEIQPTEPSDPPPPTPPPEDSPLAEDAPQSSYTQMGTISTSESLSEDTSSAQNNLAANWAIWSRRPHDPSHAPSIIISPRARPPPDVIQQALDLETPPPSPPLSPIVSKSSLVPNQEPTESTSTQLVRSDAHEPTSSLSAAWSTSQTNSTVPSSAVTESTNTPTIPGSPASSSTSISVAGTPNKDKDTSPTEKPDSVATPHPPAEPAALPATTTTPAESSSTTVPTVLTPASTTADLPNTPAPAPSDVSISVTGTDDSTKPQTIPEPAPVPSPTPAPAAAPQKKLWSSLLRSETSAASAPSSSTSPSSTPTPIRNALPTSSIVGFSIPAETLSSTSSPSSAPTTHAGASLNPAKRKELITLLTTGPNAPTPQTVSYAAATTTSSSSSNADPTQKIRLRGLINMGNMCFANSVLQVLVYCPPFHRFFAELGRVLGSKKGAALVSPPGSGSGNGNGNGKESVNLLLDATIEFLKEFGDKEKQKKEEGVVLNGRNGKGKERAPMILELGPAGDDEREDGSFLPTNVYDAMKAKKRFESMRGGHQEDAEEFFGFYLDTLEEELLAILHAVNPPPKQQQGKSQVEEKEEAAPTEDAGWYEVGKRNRTVITRTIKATESPITRIFGGKFRSTLRVPGQKDSVVVEDWRSLRLDIQRDQIHTIQEALSFISHPSPVQLSQSAKAGVVEGQQQVLIESLPPILVLHIKRFCYDTTVGGVVKVSKQVLFGPELEIGPDVMAPGTKRPTKYKLFGALYHHGHSASGGHYTLDVLHPNRYPGSKLKEGWIRMDDELVSDVTHEDVFAPNERDDGRSWSRLNQYVAESAIHTSEAVERQDMCLEGTRNIVLEALGAFLVAPPTDAPSILWMTGPAGAGKSAIMRSVARSPKPNIVILASFFFFRADSTRNSRHPLIPTLLLQIINNLSYYVPDLRRRVEAIIDNNPAILSQSSQRRADTLIVNVLSGAMRTEPTTIPIDTCFAILVDGLDECSGYDHQHEVIETLTNIVQQINSQTQLQLKLIIASRPESHIELAFAEMHEMGAVKVLRLDQRFNPDADIELFYDINFARIRRTHPMARILRLGPDWPSAEVKATLTWKASGQFAFPDTIIKFTKDLRGHPVDRLQMVLENTSPDDVTQPFAALDHLYNTVFSAVPPHLLPLTLQAIGALLAPEPIQCINGSARCLAAFLQIPLDRLQHICLFLASLFEWKTHPSFNHDVHHIMVYHASLGDFLFSRSRSERFGLFIDHTSYCQAVREYIFSALSSPNLEVLDSSEWSSCWLACAGRIGACTNYTKSAPESLIQDLVNIDPATAGPASLAHLAHLDFNIRQTLDFNLSPSSQVLYAPFVAELNAQFRMRSSIYLDSDAGRFSMALRFHTPEDLPLVSIIEAQLYRLKSDIPVTAVRGPYSVITRTVCPRLQNDQLNRLDKTGWNILEAEKPWTYWGMLQPQVSPYLEELTGLSQRDIVEVCQYLLRSDTQTILATDAVLREITSSLEFWDSNGCVSIPWEVPVDASDMAFMSVRIVTYWLVVGDKIPRTRDAFIGICPLIMAIIAKYPDATIYIEPLQALFEFSNTVQLLEEDTSLVKELEENLDRLIGLNEESPKAQTDKEEGEEND